MALRTASRAARTRVSAQITPHAHPMKALYAFEEGNKDMRPLLGGKGANLAEMTNLGLPVPPGFTITTETCLYFLENFDYPKNFFDQLDEKIRELEKKMGKIFGDRDNPLLVSVRSGAAVSMPGMMDTILNLGLNDETVNGLAEKTGSERFAWDSYRRFIQMFGNVVMNVNHDFFEDAISILKEAKNVKLDTELETEDLKKLLSDYKKIVKEHAKMPFPDNVRDQLKFAIEAVFRSWNNERATTYRRIHHLSSVKGTAVNVQSMVFGNMGNTSGTGVAFTRNPSTGAKEFYGEFLMNAQGEDVVAGIRTPQPVSELKNVLPKVYEQLLGIQEKLEKHYRDMQDMEFTVEQSRLFMLQTRNGKRTAHAAVKIAVDLVSEGLLTEREALMKIDPYSLSQLFHPRLDPKSRKKVIARGLPASPGAASGRVVFTAEDAVEWARRGEKVLLVRKETSPEDIQGMHVSKGILTSMGGLSSHAAVVARGMGTPCVAGCSALTVQAARKKFLVDDIEISEGDFITIDGGTGEVMLGEVPMIPPTVTPDLDMVLKWADEYRVLRVRANADTPEDAMKAREFGAEGIGLCRTEHMFFQEGRVQAVREMIVSNDIELRKKALSKLLPMQRDDFIGIFKVMNDYPVTIRLLDPPLHEFLPNKEEHILALSEELGISFEELKNIIANLHEVNPMLGHRGCRLAVTYPEIYEMQVEAIILACIAVRKEGIIVKPEIEMPIIAHANEMKMMRELTMRVIEKYRSQIDFDYKIGAMLELPRACLTADRISDYSEFFSFGTNDLTQTTFGISRDDVGKFIHVYVEKGIVERDPSESIDIDGVGALMKIGVEKARGAKPDIDIGICGEHGGDPASVEFCHRIGLNYVSCSPYRIVTARVAAGRVAISP